ncbi:zinc-binding dehydrogenase [Candidatus Bathyarchaeota archaeon]|nr:zinc-binding dehydrogenase [Candidatus Bathyarchaeota archaeon]
MLRLRDYVNVSDDYSLPETMQAIVLSGVGEQNIRLSTVEIPECGDDQLLARVDAAAACASDNKLIDQGSSHPLLYGWDIAKYPRIIGHEGSVTIVKVGKNLRNKFSVGERFAIQPAIPSGPRQFKERYRNYGKGIRKLAIGYTLPGLFAEYVQITEETIEAGCLLKIFDNKIPYFAAALAEPISCVIAAQERIFHHVKDSVNGKQRIEIGLKKGGTALIMGDGPMGFMNAELAMTHHPKNIIVSGHHQERIKLINKALEKRAKNQSINLICILSEQLEETIAKITDGNGVDDVIVAVGDPNAHEDAIRYVAPRGVVHFFGGIPFKNRIIKIDTHKIHYDEISVVGSSGSDPSNIVTTLEMMGKGLIDPGNYVAKCGGLDAAIPLIHASRQREILGKGIIYPHARCPLFDVKGWNPKKEGEFLEKYLVKS